MIVPQGFKLDAADWFVMTGETPKRAAR